MGHFSLSDGISHARFESNGLSEQWNSPISLWYQYEDGRKFFLALENNNGVMNLVFRSVSPSNVVLREDYIAMTKTI